MFVRCKEVFGRRFGLRRASISLLIGSHSASDGRRWGGGETGRGLFVSKRSRRSADSMRMTRTCTRLAEACRESIQVFSSLILEADDYDGCRIRHGVTRSARLWQ